MENFFLDKKYIEDLAQSLLLPKDAISSISLLLKNDLYEDKIRAFFYKIDAEDFDFIYSELKKDQKPNGLILLATTILYSKKTLNLYREKNIPYSIFIDTMKDISIWANNYYNDFGFWGFSEIKWLSRHLHLKVFKLGRLQYEFSVFPDYKNVLSLLPIPKNLKVLDNVLEVHIPEGEKLNTANCINSLKLSKEFFKKYFNDFNYEYYLCYSWLLSPRLECVLDKNSNIILFQKLFSVLYLDEDNEQYLERVFGRNYKTMKTFPSNTTLQKNIIQYISQNKKIGLGIGIIQKNKD